MGRIFVWVLYGSKAKLFQKTQKQLLEELPEQFIYRQQVITETCKARRFDDEFDEQMCGLYEIEEQLNRRLAVAEQEMDT